jgi:hypothetical protein
MRVSTLNLWRFVSGCCIFVRKSVLVSLISRVHWCFKFIGQPSPARFLWKFVFVMRLISGGEYVQKHNSISHNLFIFIAFNLLAHLSDVESNEQYEQVWGLTCFNISYIANDLEYLGIYAHDNTLLQQDFAREQHTQTIWRMEATAHVASLTVRNLYCKVLEKLIWHFVLSSQWLWFRLYSWSLIASVRYRLTLSLDTCSSGPRTTLPGIKQCWAILSWWWLPVGFQQCILLRHAVNGFSQSA